MEYIKVKLLRRVYLIFCILLGILTPIYCWYLRPGFNPMEKPLSDFGIQEPTWLLWNSTLVFLAIGIFLNAYTALRFYFKKGDTAILLRCFCLFLLYHYFLLLLFLWIMNSSIEFLHSFSSLPIICLCSYLVCSGHLSL